MFDYSKFAYYAVVNRDIRGSVGFSSWSDNDGNHYRAINGYDTKGVPKAFNINFSSSELIYRAGKNQKVTVLVNNVPDAKPWLLSKYLEESSLCEGSPNLRGPAVFKKVDEEKDATILIDAKKLKKEASDAAFALESNNKELAQVAALIGEFRDNKDIQFAAVIQFAEADPKNFLEIVKDLSKVERALLKKAVKVGVVKEQGKMLSWNSHALGTDEDDAVRNLTKDKDLFKALELDVKKLK